MIRNMCAVVRMEEMYIRLTIEYGELKSKERIIEAIQKIIKQTKLAPNILERALNKEAGNISVEFSTENNRDAGNFFDQVMQELNITFCD